MKASNSASICSMLALAGFLRIWQPARIWTSTGAEEEGAPPPHHFYVTFRTRHPGVVIPEFTFISFQSTAVERSSIRPE